MIEICTTCEAFRNDGDVASYFPDLELIQRVERWRGNLSADVKLDGTYEVNSLVGVKNCACCNEAIHGTAVVLSNAVDTTSHMIIEDSYGQVSFTLSLSELESLLPAATGWLAHKGFDSYVDRFKSLSRRKHNKAVSGLYALTHDVVA